MNRKIIPAINLHLTRSCNMNCNYCFAKFNHTRGTYPYRDTVLLIKMLRDFGFEKINFVGGEPMLIKNIVQLIKYAKKTGFYTSLVSNGSLITPEFLHSIRNDIDVIGISIDSLSTETNKLIGRKNHKKPMSIEDYKKIVDMINLYNIGLKINTVVSKLNKDEQIADFINYANPLRWKVFQVLKVDGENDHQFNEYEVTDKEFEEFCKNQMKSLTNKSILIKEGNDLMRGSYLMINPEGLFFDNTKGGYTVSGKIIQQGIEKSLKHINFDFSKYTERNGNYFSKIKKIAV